MDSSRVLITALVIAVILLPLLRILAWCLSDLSQRATDVPQSVRTQWLVLLLILNVFAAPAYITVGPGRDRWDPDCLWPWKKHGRS